MTDFPAGSGKAEVSSALFYGIKGIIFDFDGTLYDYSRIALYLIAANPFDLFRIRRERMVRKSFTGSDYSSPEDYYRAFFTVLGEACSGSPEQLRDWYFNRYMPEMIRILKRHYKPRPGLEDLFRRFSTGGRAVPKIAIYSDYPLLKERMGALGINPGPEIPLYSIESFGAQKPAPRPFQCIARDLGAAPSEILVVGDSEDTDGIGAVKAGMDFFCLKGRKCWDELYTQLMETFFVS